MSEGAHTPTPIGAPVRRFLLRPHQLVSDITPTADVFVLAPIGVPRVDVAAWRLEVAGLVERPLTLSFDDILQFPKQELRAFHQCAGDPRRPTFATRRITNVIWGGIDLARVLAGVTIKPGASLLWASGLDHGEYAGQMVDAYVKDVPLDEAISEAFLAYELNGAPLSAEHGFPLRLVMPGYYGTNSVKWLSRLELADGRPQGLFTTKLYNDPVPPSAEQPAGGSRPVWRTAPESVIVSPQPGQQLSDDEVQIWGWAWAHRSVRQVEVTIDGGRTWRIATLGQPSQRSWQRFHLSWIPEESGPAVLMSRATDLNGEVQPQENARNAIYNVTVDVVAKKGEG